MFGPGGLAFELLPEVGHIDPNVVGAVYIGWTPDIEKKLAVREHFALPTDQSREQAKLPLG
jgi:hypothetical protein